MPPRLPLKALTFCLLVLSTTAAAQAPQATQEATARKGLQRKALALLDETLEGAQALTRAEDRAFLRMQAADLLWPHDKKRARALFRDAAADLAAVNTERRGNVVRGRLQPYWDFFYTVAARDARLALKLLRDSRRASGGDSNAPAGDPDRELEMERALKKFAAAFDSKTALRLAEEDLSKGFTYEVLAMLQRLCRKDPKAATELAGKIVERLRGETPDGGNKAWGPAVILLRGVLLPKPGGKPHYYNIPGAPSPEWMWPNPLVMEEADLRELADLVAAAALKDSYANGARALMVMSIRELIPDLEKLVPARAAQLNLRLAEMDKPLNPSARALAQYSTIMRRPPEVILEEAAQASAETRRHFYRAAAAKLFAAGEVERARAVVTENLSGQERDDMLDHLDDAEITRAIEQGKPDDARATVSRIKSNERRAAALAEVAAAYAARGDKKTALGLLEEARGLIGRLPVSRREAEALLDIARSYALVEPARTFELIDTLIDFARETEKRLAAQLLQRYVWGLLFDPQDELTLSLVGSLWGGTYFTRLIKMLPELARMDFDRTRRMTDRLTPDELRLMARLFIARGILSNRPDPTAGTSSRWSYYVP